MNIGFLCLEVEEVLGPCLPLLGQAREHRMRSPDGVFVLDLMLDAQRVDSPQHFGSVLSVVAPELKNDVDAGHLVQLLIGKLGGPGREREIHDLVRVLHLAQLDPLSDGHTFSLYHRRWVHDKPLLERLVAPGLRHHATVGLRLLILLIS